MSFFLSTDRHDLDEFYDPYEASSSESDRDLHTISFQSSAPGTPTHSFRSSQRRPRLIEDSVSRRAIQILGLPRSVQINPSFTGHHRACDLPGSLSADRTTISDCPQISQLLQRVADSSFDKPFAAEESPYQLREALTFALGALELGDGKNCSALSAQSGRKRARMSDLLAVDRAGVSNGNTRVQNGQSRARGGVPVPAARVRTPTDVMRARREREERRKAQEEQEQETRLRELEQEQSRILPEPAVPGSLAGDVPARRRSSRREGRSTKDSASRASDGLMSSRRQENTPMTASNPVRSRATAPDQGQPRPVDQQSRSASHQQQSAPIDIGSGPARTSRIRQTSQVNADELENSRDTQTDNKDQVPGGRSSFPNALERWETLSSHWEGLTSYWIRRLQENSNEMKREPLNQQMSRQIVDLSAAGSNLFLAVFELQRLRASSDRKFQRYFLETRAELERYQAQQAEFDRLLRVEREERVKAVSSTGTAEAERLKAEDLVKEMRRELQISKEEARRAWEELGRREQEERDRTVSLRSGEPTLMGGVQVVPMTQGVPGHQSITSSAPLQPRAESPDDHADGTRMSQHGPGGLSYSESHTTLGSPDEEERQFSHYQPGDHDAHSTTDASGPDHRREGPESGHDRQETAETSHLRAEETESSNPGFRQSQRQTGSVGNGQQAPDVGQDGSAWWVGDRRQASPGASHRRRGEHPEDYGSRSEEAHHRGTGERVHGRRQTRLSDDQFEHEDVERASLPREQEAIHEHTANYYAGAGRQQQQHQNQREQGPSPHYSTAATMAGPSTGTLPPPTMSRSNISGGSVPSGSAAPSTPPNMSAATGGGLLADYSGSDYGPGSGNGNGDYTGHDYNIRGGHRNDGSSPSGNDGGERQDGNGWNRFSPRHRHPTRLSDIPEQDDERSRRTSPNLSRTSWISGTAPNEPGSAGMGAAVGRSGWERRER